MKKKPLIRQSRKRTLKLKVLAKKKESVRRRLVVTAENLRLKAKQLAILAKERESIRRRLEITAEKLALTAKERESIRQRLVVTAKQLAVTANERESIRRRLEVTAGKLAVTAKERESVRRRLVVTAEKLAVTAKERESVRQRLAVTAQQLAVTAKERESVRRRLVVTAEKLAVTAKERESVRQRLVVIAQQLAVTAKERESVRRRLEVTAENLRLKAKQLAVTAKERESVRHRLESTADQLAVTAKEKESVRHRLAVTAHQLLLKAKQLAATAQEKESVRQRLEVTAENLRLKAKQLAVTAKERESIRRKLALTAIDLEQFGARNTAMLEGIGDGLVATDKNERILLVNKAFQTILGWKESFVKGKLMSDIMPMVDETGKEVPASKRPITMTIREHTTTKTTATSEIATAKGDKEPVVASSEIAKAKGDKEPAIPETTPGVYYYVRKDKTKFPTAVTVAPVRLGGKIIGAIEVFRDITREKEIDRAKTEFITLASHQLKTPPTAIKLLTERLLGGKMGSFTEKQKEYFDDIHATNQRMIDLVNALLNVSRIELGAFTIKVNEKDVSAVIQSILDDLKPVIDKKKLILKTNYPYGKVLLLLDESLFRMVINNLVTNAIRYTDEGDEIEVTGKAVDKGQSVGGKLMAENSFVVSVSDTGYGVPQKDQDKLFTKFFRADNARAKLPDGTGLGLYIVKSVLDHSGGLIWFTSKENEGSSFYVSIPMTGMRAKIGEKTLIG